MYLRSNLKITPIRGMTRGITHAHHVTAFQEQPPRYPRSECGHHRAGFRVLRRLLHCPLALRLYNVQPYPILCHNCAGYMPQLRFSLVQLGAYCIQEWLCTGGASPKVGQRIRCGVVISPNLRTCFPFLPATANFIQSKFR